MGYFEFMNVNHKRNGFVKLNRVNPWFYWEYGISGKLVHKREPVYG